MKRPSVSVIIPTYNRSAYLVGAIESVLSQSYCDLEIIVVDDGSTDNTQDVISGYGDRVRYLFQENKGPSSARNLGISAAEGDLIAFLDSDDLWRRDKLEKQVELFEQNSNIGLVASGHDLVNERGELISNYSLKSTELKQLHKKQMLRNLFSTPSVIVRKSCFQSVGVFNEKLYFAEDWDMWLRIINAYDSAFINAPLVTIRKHSESITREYSEKNLRDWESVIASNSTGKCLLFDVVTLRRYSWFYWNKANIYRNKGNAALNYLIRSILAWPFGHGRRYLQLMKWVVGKSTMVRSNSTLSGV